MNTNHEENAAKMLPIDRFEILRELGRGGTSIVYLVKSKQSGRRYAMKLLKPELAEARHKAELAEARHKADLAEARNKAELAEARREAESGGRGKGAGNSEELRINAGNQEEFSMIAEELLRAEAQTLAELNDGRGSSPGFALFAGAHEASGGTRSNSSDSKPDSEPDSISDNKPDSIPGSEPDSMPGSEPVSIPDSKPGSIPFSLQSGIPAYYGEVYRGGDFAGFLMEYVEGESLQKLLDDGRVFTVREAAEMGVWVCRVLARMHEMEPPRIYRDLKPGNVLVREDGNCVLVDYGAVRAFRRGAAGDTHPLGTEGYAAPEQYGGWEQSDPRTDVYGVGAVLHHMLTGRPPLETGLRPLSEVMEGGSRGNDQAGREAAMPARREAGVDLGAASQPLTARGRWFAGGPAQEVQPLTARGRWFAGGPAQEAQQLAEMDKILARCCSIAPSMRFSSCRELENALGRLCKERSETAWRRLVTLLCVTLSLLVLAGLFGAAASGTKRSRYRSLIREAEAAGTQEEQLALFRQAAKIRPGDAEAHVALLKKLASDGVFTQEEKDLLDSFLYENGFLPKTRSRKSSEYAVLEMELGKVCFGFFEGGMESARRCFENVADTAGAGAAARKFARAMRVVTGDEWTAERAEAWLFVVREAAGEAMESGDGAFAAAVCSRAAGEIALFPDRFESAEADQGVLREVKESVAGFARAVDGGWPLVPAKLAAELRTAVEAMERVTE